MLALFSFVRANESQSGPREWTPAQFEELQLQAMSCLCALCPKMLEDYMTVQGSTRILLLLEWCVGAGINTIYSFFMKSKSKENNLKVSCLFYCDMKLQ
jgi:hypothetical protein